MEKELGQFLDGLGLSFGTSADLSPSCPCATRACSSGACSLTGGCSAGTCSQSACYTKASADCTPATSACGSAGVCEGSVNGV